MIVCVCCNDPDNGSFVGRCLCISYGDLELRHDDWLHGCALSYLPGGKLRIGRRVFQYVHAKEWYGNWCWDAVLMERKEARRLLRWLRSTGVWSCECGPTRLYDWFNAPSAKEALDVYHDAVRVERP